MQKPVGIDFVFVNGGFVIEDGAPTGGTPKACLSGNRNAINCGLRIGDGGGERLDHGKRRKKGGRKAEDTETIC